MTIVNNVVKQQSNKLYTLELDFGNHSWPFGDKSIDHLNKQLLNLITRWVTVANSTQNSLKHIGQQIFQKDARLKANLFYEGVESCSIDASKLLSSSLVSQFINHCLADLPVGLVGQLNYHFRETIDGDTYITITIPCKSLLESPRKRRMVSRIRVMTCNVSLSHSRNTITDSSLIAM
jgi:hypothetical protein